MRAERLRLVGGFTASHRRRAMALAVVGTSALVLAMAPAGRALAGPTAGSNATSVATPVIVFLRDQPAVSPASVRSAGRRDMIAASQAPFLRELAQVHATHVETYSLVDAFAATVSAGEEQVLAADPAVAQVIPDATIKGPSTAVEAPRAGGSARAHAATGTDGPLSGACLPRGGVELEPEGLALTGTDSQVAGAKTARSLGFTGAGVTVGYLADGIDPDNANFIKPDGKSVFTRYVDFSGDGINAPTDGGEAFLDANSIAGQGTVVYNTQGFSVDLPSAPCDVRIEGVAPGVNLVGLKVFAQDDDTTTSGFLQAIDYAVETAKVNVLNESFGSNDYPDTTLNAEKEFDDAAVAAGVTVTVSTGDSGPTNTISSPASDPNVISAGASTDFRYFGQTGDGGAEQFATKGWLDDNISAFSSSGYSQTGSTVDLVAPGDSSFTSCDNSSKYSGCTNLFGAGSDLQTGSGTSESAPEVAGAAALVIQAYRSTHDGATPSPALIKRILLSTASDLGAPAENQGAGLLDSYKAVEMAMSVGKGTATGETVATSANQLGYVGAAGTKKSWKVTVTNTGAATQAVHLSGRGYAPARVISTGSVTLSDTKSPHFNDASGNTDNYGKIHFTVGKGVAELNAAIAYPGSAQTGSASLVLIDPEGRYAAYSYPPGVFNYGIASVLHPAAGTWTAAIFSPTSGDGGTVGKIPFEATTTRYARFGAVSPATVTLAPGASSVVSVTATTPAAAGDASGAVLLNSGHGTTAIPVTLRSLVNVARGGAFSGVLTGGNGHDSAAQAGYYEFSVPPGRRAVSVNLTLANDRGDQVVGYLVAPDGETVADGSNSYVSKGAPTGTNVANVRALSLYALRPAAGTWTLILELLGPVVGNEITDRYTGTIRFATLPVSARGLPDSAAEKLTPGKAVTVPVTIKNTGASAEDFFVDPRLNSARTYTLALIAGRPVEPLPLPADGQYQWNVPTQTTTLHVTARASLPVTFDYAVASGDPDLTATSSGDTAIGTFSADPVTPGTWATDPSEIVPAGYPAKGGKAGTVRLTITAAVSQAFDPTITSAPGDPWRTVVAGRPPAWKPFAILPGQTRTIDVTIRPSGKAGTVVRGDLYVDDLTVRGDLQAGGEIAAIPYAYQIG